MATDTIMQEAKELGDLLVGSPDKVAVDDLYITVDGKVAHYRHNPQSDFPVDHFSFARALPDGRTLKVYFGTVRTAGMLPRAPNDRLEISVEYSQGNLRGFQAEITGLAHLDLFRKYTGPATYLHWAESHGRANAAIVDRLSTPADVIELEPEQVREKVKSMYLKLVKDATAIIKGEQQNLTVT